jgi:predicted CXXCH cytochrome family protein
MKRIYTFLLVFGILISSIIFWQCSSDSRTQEIVELIHNHYVGSNNCKECHPKEFNDWLGSDHDLAMEIPTDKSVLGDFTSPDLELDGVLYSFSNNNNEYNITITEEGKTNTFKVLYTFGFSPLQQYLVETKKGEIQTLRLTWDSDKNRWYHQNEGTKIPKHDWLHWENNSMNWTTMCASCHSTNVKKNFNEKTWTYNTTYDEIDVSCEGCHGAGSNHAKNMKENISYKDYGHIEKENLVDNCASCHSRRTALSHDMNPHKDFNNFYIAQKLVSPFYHPDGQINDEVYVYSSFLSSKMYQNNVICTDCHNPHTNKLKFEGNALCTQCHESNKFNSPSHTNHEENSEGSLCINCHMDGKNYMGNDYRRDHSFRIPRPDQSVKYGTPNSCNSCHENKSEEWAAKNVEKWFGTEREYHFSDDLIPGSLMDNQSEDHLIHLLESDSVNPIAKATAIEYLANILSEKGLDSYIKAFESKDVVVRESAYGSLLPLQQLALSYPQLWKGINDKFKSVRILCFRSLFDMEIPQQYKNAFYKVEKEYLLSLDANADMPNGQVNKGQYYARKGNIPKAIIHYEKAVELDDQQYTQLYNLHYLYCQNNEYAKAKPLLEKLLNVDDSNINYNYAYGIVLASLGKNQEAITQLEKLIKLENQHSDGWYNLITLYIKENNMKMAKLRLEKATNLFPNNTKISSLKSYLKI